MTFIYYWVFIYTTVGNSVLSFLTLIEEGKGPFKNFDFMLFFFVIKIPALLLNETVELSLFFTKNGDLTIQARVISPFILYLYLNPLYSNLGGSTIRAEFLTNNPGFVVFLLKPLYRWNIFTQHTFVLSDI